MNRFLPIILFFTMGFSVLLKAQPAGCGDLFFSEYVEGTSFEKYIEIYNPTGGTIDLSDYQLRLFSNGAATPTQTLTLSGMLTSGATIVVRNGASTGFTGGIVSSTVVNHNGDDAYDLFKISTGAAVDIFGRIGNDPGSAWTATGLSTVDRTLRRKTTVTGGVTVNPSGTGATAFTTLETEWDGFTVNDISGLGAHTSDCIVIECVISAIGLEFISSCNDQGTITGADDTYTANVIVVFSGAPSSGTLDLTGDGSASVDVDDLDSETDHTFMGVVLPVDGGPHQLTAAFSEEGACSLTYTTPYNSPGPCSVIPDCGALFFSEYVEGSGNNKCLEIYNPTGADIDLAAGGYQIKMYFNGSAAAGLTVNLTGVIPSGGVYVVCNSSATSEFTSLADQLAGGGWFNGNDAIELSSDEGTLDVIGQIGNSANFAENVTVRRNYAVQKGDNIGSDAFSAAAEWSNYASNTSWGLGYHATDCQPALPQGWNPFAIGCSGTTSNDDGEWTQTTNCVSPGVTNDNVAFAFQELCGNGEIKAQVTVNDYSGSAGVMIRESLSPGAKMAWMFRRQGNQVFFKARSTTNGPAVIFAKPWLPSYKYIKLARNGTSFAGYVSTNGTTWIKLFQVFMNLNNCTFIGMATESNVGANTVSATFNDVWISGSQVRPESLETDFENAPSVENLGIYPNPAQNELNVELPASLEGQAGISIVDLNGKVLYHQLTEAGDRILQMDLQSLNLSAGVYLIRVENGQERFIQRFVKQ